ncbi:MAG: 5-formyltetrahydrofolate cyclo-ligase [Alphaproteobacteria bacterium]|nr:5-formyltetrahydrofolate cyclo-ligase [Alphaproteobacteria bacterium]
MVAPPTPTDPVIAEAKRTLRNEMRARRERLADPSAGPRLAQNVASLAPFATGAATAGFHPMPPEIDVLPSLAWFASRGHRVGLPVVVGRGQPLIFRFWLPGAPLERGMLGIPFPPADKPEIHPQLLLVPLIAFDRRGNRLGYGGGYYDRTLAALRAKGPLLTIGVAFSFQEVDEVPIDPFDAPLDAIATEAGAERLQ